MFPTKEIDWGGEVVKRKRMREQKWNVCLTCSITMSREHRKNQTYWFDEQENWVG